MTAMLGPWDALVAVLVAVVIVVALRGGRRLSLRAGPVSAEVHAVREVAAQVSLVAAELADVSRAVNHQPDGTATLVQRVAVIEARLKAIETRLAEGTALHRQIVASLTALQTLVGGTP